MIKDFIARLLGIETYLDLAVELQEENEKLNDAVFTAYKLGRQSVLDEIKNNTSIDEIEINDLVDLIGDESHEIN